VVLSQLDFYKSTVVDSARVRPGDSRIGFNASNITEPTFLTLQVKGRGAITLLVEAGERVMLNVDVADLLNYSVEGSKGSALVKELNAVFAQSKQRVNDLRKQYAAASNELEKSRLEREFAAVIDSQRAYSSRFIWANPMSRASVMALYQKYDENTYLFDRSEDMLLYKMVASSLKALHPESSYTKGMLADIARMEKIISNSKLNRIIKQAEASIPEIALPNPKGDTIRLSSLRGKVILLDFWASWNQSSLLDNRELLEIYREFKGKGFEVYQVSLDHNREEWVNAIESANLPWINVSELNPKGSYAARIYNVSQLPANYLIGRSQTIEGKNLYGDALRKRLREIL
jgi:peroxiredoxin